MQTFYPYEDINKTVKCLDNKRLGKQRVETIQIALCLLVKESRWKNHPAVKMWKGYEKYLVEIYLYNIMNEWKLRGYKNTKCEEHYNNLSHIVKDSRLQYPHWLGNEQFHNSHKSNLLRKFPEHYFKFNWNITNDLSYIWPN